MSFSWWCRDKKRKDLFDEFQINGQAFGLGDDGESSGGVWIRFGSPVTLTELREEWCRFTYKEKLADSAQDAVEEIQTMVRANLQHYAHGLHFDQCPTCACGKPEVGGFDTEEAERFLSIPLERVHRAGGGY